jgi:hypothetical protein
MGKHREADSLIEFTLKGDHFMRCTVGGADRLDILQRCFYSYDNHRKEGEDAKCS